MESELLMPGLAHDETPALKSCSTSRNLSDKIYALPHSLPLSLLSTAAEDPR